MGLQDIMKAKIAESFVKSKTFNDLLEEEDFNQFCCDKNQEDRDSGELQDLSIKERLRLIQEWQKQKSTYKNPYKGLK